MDNYELWMKRLTDLSNVYNVRLPWPKDFDYQKAFDIGLSAEEVHRLFEVTQRLSEMSKSARFSDADYLSCVSAIFRVMFDESMKLKEQLHSAACLAYMILEDPANLMDDALETMRELAREIIGKEPEEPGPADVAV